MLCYISQPNRQWLEIEIDPKQSGQVILDKALHELGIIEADFFGLQFKGPKKEDLWLNLRNRICDQLIGCSHECHLSLRVKFFVQPHLVQQDRTKELFYTQAKDAMNKGHINPGDDDTMAKLIAAIAQAENGDQTGNFYQKTAYADIVKELCPSFEASQYFIEKTFTEHSKLQGVSRSSARYLMLKVISGLPGYGVESHKVTNAQGQKIHFGVGPEGVILKDSKTSTERVIPYLQIRLATHDEKSVYIQLIDDAGEPQGEESFKLVSKKAAMALYRCITEMHSFYRCDTVCHDVHSQYSRDFKGTVVSIFIENSELGKRYMFDIQRTRQEAYDHVRRKLYSQSNNSASVSPVHNHHGLYGTNNDVEDYDEHNEEVDIGENKAVGGKPLGERNKNEINEIKKLKRRLEQVEDSLLCCICMYQRVCVVLCPCGHMTCDECAERIQQCPQCRTDIERLQRVFQNFGAASSKVCKEEVKRV